MHFLRKRILQSLLHDENTNKNSLASFVRRNFHLLNVRHFHGYTRLRFDVICICFYLIFSLPLLELNALDLPKTPAEIKPVIVHPRNNSRVFNPNEILVEVESFPLSGSVLEWIIVVVISKKTMTVEGWTPVKQFPFKQLDISANGTYVGRKIIALEEGDYKITATISKMGQQKKISSTESFFRVKRFDTDDMDLAAKIIPPPLDAIRQPDLTPAKLYFDNDCNLKAVIKNKGLADYEGDLEWNVERDGVGVTDPSLFIKDLHILSNETREITLRENVSSIKLSEWVLVLGPSSYLPEYDKDNNTSAVFSLRCVPRQMMIASRNLAVSPSAQVIIGSAGGTATYMVTGGQPPYDVATNDTNFQPLPSAVADSGGTFNVAVPANSSAQTITYTVTDSANKTASALLGLTLAKEAKGNEMVKKGPKIQKSDVKKHIQKQQGSVNKKGLFSIIKVFQMLNPIKNFEYNARVEGKGKKWREMAHVIIRARSPEKTNISFLLKQRLSGEQQFKDLESWESKEDDMRWMQDIKTYQYLLPKSLEPAEYQLIANPHNSNVRPKQIVPIRFTVIGEKTRELRKHLKAGISVIILNSKRSYHPGEQVVFEMTGDTGTAPVIECIDHNQWTTRCPQDVAVRTIGMGEKTRYLLHAATPGKYRLRVGKLVSDEIEVKRVRGKKTALIKPSKKVPGTKKEHSTVSPLTTQAPPEKERIVKKQHPLKTLRPPVIENLTPGTTYTTDTSVSFTLKSPSSHKGCTITYELYRNACTGRAYKVSSSGAFGILKPGRYCVRVGSRSGKESIWSDGMLFTVEERKLKVKQAPAVKHEGTPAVKHKEMPIRKHKVLKQ